MGIDLALFREGGDPELVKESQRRRFKDEKIVDEVIAANARWKALRYELDQANRKRKLVLEDIKKKRQSGEDTKDLVTEKTSIEERIKQLEGDVAKSEAEVEQLLKPVGNIVHASVPVSNNEEHNELVKTWGEFQRKPGLRHHHEILAMIDAYDPARGVAVAGHRAYFLKGVGVLLNYALINYSLDFLTKRCYTMLQPPFMMNTNIMANTAQLEQFDEELYKVTYKTFDVKSEHWKEDEKYLIATSEQPISAFHQGEWLDPKILPLRYGGISTCFRKEAGAHGKDTWGIFRVHQFEKIEQFCITSPESSWTMHEEMLKVAEEFYQSLGIPYRVVNIVSGALNNAAAKKYDLEAWFPSFEEKDQQFRELVSCSNCTDYQSRSMEIRYGSKKQGEKEKKYVHMLNSTLCATTRTICAIMENYQSDEGVIIPEPLRPYLGGKMLFPFVIKFEDLPKPKGLKEAKKDGHQNQ